MSSKAKVNQVVLIVIDDVRASHLFDLMDNGKLPNIAQLAKSGIMSRNCITSFPSITFPCYSNIIIGAYSGYYPKEGSGIPTYHWINRSDPPSKSKRLPFIRSYSPASGIRRINNDLGANVQTIFEQAGKGNLLSAMNIVNRGSIFQPPKIYNTEMILKIVEEAFQTPEKFFSTKEVPKVTACYVPKTDDLMHHRGFDHPEYINEILKCDKGIGTLVKTLKNAGYYDSTAICVISDHGNYKAEQMYDLEPFFERKGLIPYVPKKKIIGDFDATFGSIGFFNFRGETWDYHPNIEQMKNFKPSGIGSKELNLFEILWEIPGVKLMYYRDDDNTPDKGIIHLERRFKKTGKKLKGKIEYEGHGKNQKTKYTFDDEDLFGYDKSEDAMKLLDNKTHSIDEWLTATYQIDCPILIDQIPRYFKNPRSCDIMISTIGEYGFGYEHGKTVATYPYSHDIALKKSMTVPLIIGGSAEVPSIEIPYCKTTDAVPTLLDLLGIKPHWSVVGKTLLNYE
ncbi:MAG: alkaline phosphatase family protein [Promethearchaeota archaeon]